MGSWPVGAVAQSQNAPVLFEESSASSETSVISSELFATLAASETTYSPNHYSRSADSISIVCCLPR